MTILKIRDANGAIVNVSVTGSGTEIDPYIPIHEISNLSEISILQSAGNTDLASVKLNTDKIPAQKDILSVTGSVVDSGDTTLIVGTPGKSIVISAFCLQNESNTPTTMILKNGDTPFWRVRCASNGDGIVKDYPSDVRLILSLGNSLRLNVSDAGQIGYSVNYYLVSV